MNVKSLFKNKFFLFTFSIVFVNCLEHLFHKTDKKHCSIGSRIVAVLEGIDETGNAILGPISNIPQAGNPHYTMSQRWGYILRDGTPVQKFFIKPVDWVLTFVEKRIVGIWIPSCRSCTSHCLGAIMGFPDDLPYSG